MLKVVLFHSHDFIGEFTTSYRELSRGQSQFNVYEVKGTSCPLRSLHLCLGLTSDFLLGSESKKERKEKEVHQLWDRKCSWLVSRACLTA